MHIKTEAPPKKSNKPAKTNGLQMYIVDFHTHVINPEGLLKLCPENQKSLFFRYIVPILEPIANLSHPLHDRLVRYLAINYRNELSRLVYACCGELGLMEALRLFKTYDLPRLIQSMDRQNISHAVICSLEPLTSTQDIIDETQSLRNRISVFASFSAQQKDSPAYIEKFIRDKSISGIKIHPIVGGFACNGLFEATKDVLALASENNLPVSIHTGHIPVEALTDLSGCTQTLALEPLISAFPKCQFILNHMGWEQWRDALQLAHKYPNIILETSWQPARIIRRVVDDVGANRVLFGSDFPLFQQEQALKHVRSALTEDEFTMVTSANALRLLRLDPAVTKAPSTKTR